jgi:DNA-binding IclR family transcriptional regulator
MRGEHTAVDGEVPITEAKLQATLENIRKLGYLERDSQQSFGVVDISFPILGPGNVALAALTCPYIRRIDTHIGPDLQTARELLGQAARALSLTHSAARGA